MIGYIQNMEPEDVLADVQLIRHEASGLRLLARQQRLGGARRNAIVTGTIEASLDSSRVEVNHFWIDLGHLQV